MGKFICSLWQSEQPPIYFHEEQKKATLGDALVLRHCRDYSWLYEEKRERESQMHWPLSMRLLSFTRLFAHSMDVLLFSVLPHHFFFGQDSTFKRIKNKTPQPISPRFLFFPAAIKLNKLTLKRECGDS